MKSRTWTLLSKHGQALVCLSRQPDMRISDLAKELGMTERAIRLVLAALKASRVVKVLRHGRNNRYEVDLDYALSHPIESQVSLRHFLELSGMKEQRVDEIVAMMEGGSLDDGVGVSPGGIEKAAAEASTKVG